MAAHDIPRESKEAAPVMLELGGLAASAQRIDEMPEIAGHRIEGHQQQIERGEVLKDHEEAIAFHIKCFERRSSPRRMRIAMFDNGIGNVEAFPARPASAQAEIGVLAIQEEA